jgi:penicillin-binding protein 1A
LAAAIGGSLWTMDALRGLDRDFAALTAYHPGEATLVYASDGSLLARIAKENRIRVPLERIPPTLRNATIMAEDRRFWQHPGVDFRGLARALWRDVRTGRPAEGGSTLTMQLVRSIRLTPEKTLKRKVREAALALKMERTYDKPHLLEMYLNQVYYGSGAYGVGSAARTYFGRSVEHLSAAQAALLATLPRRPTEFNPYRDPQGSLERRNRLLKEMASQGVLSPKQFNRARSEPLGVKSRGYESRMAPYFVDAVVDRLSDLYGNKAVYEGGLRVYTTLNPTLQRAAEKAVAQGVSSLRGRNVSQGALLCLDPQTGEIKAMVGGKSYQESPFNRALMARRQPGSSFKPFVYAAAMDAGYSPFDRITDAPIHLASWNPKNHYTGYAGQTTLVNAFAQSMNIPAVKLALAVGIDRVAETAQSCGIRSPLHRVPSLALGTSEVTLLELTSAYGVFPSLGQWCMPQLFRRVTSQDGKINDSFPSMTQNVMDLVTAQKLDFLLRATVKAGTARAVASIPKARGKTGTTQQDKDAWFIGYTPELVTGVWVGNDRPVRMYGVWGGTGCAPIWRNFMARALKTVPHRPDLPKLMLPKPPPMTAPTLVASVAGPGKGYSDAPEWRSTHPEGDEGEFWSNSQSTSAVPGMVRICLQSGQLAGPRCPETLLVPSEEAQTSGLCTVHTGEKDSRKWTSRSRVEDSAWDQEGSGVDVGDRR